MGVFAELHAEGMVFRDLLRERGIRELPNTAVSLPLDQKDIEHIQLIKSIFGSKFILNPKKIDVLMQRNYIYNDSGRFICIVNRDNETGKGYQEYYGFREFEKQYEKYIKQPEKLICYSTLYSKYPTSDGTVRSMPNLHRTSIFIQDLDAGKEGMPIKEQLERINKLIVEKKILLPNLLLFTGTGIQPVWFIDNLMMKERSKVHETWVGIQKAMFEAFKEVGLKPDEAVFQPFHNTRMVDTINLRADGNTVKGYVLHTDRKRLGDFINHYFGQLHDVFKKNPSKKEFATGQVVKSPKFWNMHSYAWGIIQDMKLIPVLKKKMDEPLEGLQWRWRMATVVRFFALVYYVGDERMALKEVEDWWETLTPDQQEGTSLREIVRRSKTAQRYYKEFKNDKFDKKKYKRAGLFYKNQTFIDELELSVDIQLNLNIIKKRTYTKKNEEGKLVKKYDTEYERKRKTLENRNKGIRSHDDKKSEKIALIKAVLEANPKVSIRKISEETGIPKSTVSDLKKEFGLK